MSIVSTDETNAIAILGRLLDPETLPPQAAAYILSLSFPERDRERMNVLAEKAREGSLTSKEQAEVENFCEVGDLLGIMQSKARVALKKAAAPRR